MGYGTKGRKPIERASKIAHTEIIKNPEVQAYVRRCEIPTATVPDLLDCQIESLRESTASEVAAIVAVDGGFTETYVREDHPSASIAFFTFGPLLFELADLRALDGKRFIAPEDLARLKRIERYSLVLPTKGIRRTDKMSLAETIRSTIFEFFVAPRGENDN